MVKILIDPGHYKNINAGHIAGYYEGNAMFALAGYLVSELNGYAGLRADMTKVDVGDNPTVDARGKVAADGGYDMFLSLHSDAHTMGSGACGATIFRSVKLPGSEVFLKKLGDAIVGVMKPVTGNSYLRGVQTKTKADGTDYYGVVSASVNYKSSKVKVSALVEHGFHTNPQECAALHDDALLRRLAQAEAQVIADYYGATKATGGAGDGTTSTGAAPTGLKFRTYSSYYAGTGIADVSVRFVADRANEPKIKLRACEDGKLRLYKPVAAYEDSGTALKSAGPDTLVLMEAA